MTSPHPDGVPGPEAGHAALGGSAAAGAVPGDSVLSRLIAIDSQTFADDHWGRQPLLSTAEQLPRAFGDLLSADTIDELVSERGLRTPFLRVAKNGTTLAEHSFTAAGGVGAQIADQVSDDKLVGLFGDGATMVLQALHRMWPPILQLCQQLAGELGHPVQANAYVTPPQNQGFSNHYDVHDVFVLQIEGEKRWRIHTPVLDAPLRDQPWTDRRSAVAARAAEEPLLEAVLRPGDCLYLPRGYLHAATALGGVSTHLTIGVHTWTRYALAEQLVAQALRTVAADADVRGSLALGVDLDEPVELRDDADAVRAALIAALERTDIEQAAAALRRSNRNGQRAAPIGPLRQLRTADGLDDATELVLRQHLALTLDQTGSRTLLRSRAGELLVAEEDLPAVKALLDAGRAVVSDLGAGLARRLLFAGVLVAPTPQAE